MDERDDLRFDELLSDQLSDLPPTDQVVERTGPWLEPIDRIVAGLALTTLQLGFLWLDYILPTVGVVLLFLGFRSLRRENKWFFAAWIFAALRMVGQAVILWGLAIPWESAPLEITPLNLTAVIAFQAGFFLLFRQGLRETFRKAGAVQEKDPLLWAAAWSTVAVLLAASPLSNSWLVFIPMVGLYIHILKTLYHIPDALEDVGYALEPAPVRVSDDALRRLYLLGCLGLILIGCLLGHHVPLEEQPWQAPVPSQTRQELEGLGFPAHLLADLPDQAVEGLEAAVYVDVSQELLMFDPRTEPLYNSYGLEYSTHKVPGQVNLDVTAVTVELPGNDLRAFLFFAWKEGEDMKRDRAPFWTDGFSLSVGSQAILEGVSGQLLYDSQGQSRAAAIPGLTCSSRTVEGFWGASENDYVTGKVNYPSGAAGRRGWIMTGFTLPEHHWVGYLQLNYARVSHPLHYPYTDPVGTLFQGLFPRDNVQQFYTTFDTLASSADKGMPN